MTCNYCFPTGTIFQINSEFREKGTFRLENRTSCLVGLKTHPTIVPRSGIELTTSRLHSFIMAKVSHALNHSAMEAVEAHIGHDSLVFILLGDCKNAAYFVVNVVYKIVRCAPLTLI